MGDYDYLIKFLALGDSGVGKTSFLVCFSLTHMFYLFFQLQFTVLFLLGTSQKGEDNKNH